MQWQLVKVAQLKLNINNLITQGAFRVNDAENTAKVNENLTSSYKGVKL